MFERSQASDATRAFLHSRLLDGPASRLRVMTHDNDEHTSHSSFSRSRYAVGFVIIGAGVVFFLLTQHRAHFLGTLP